MQARAASHRGQPAEIPKQEHSIPWFWPLAAGIELGEAGLLLFDGNVRFAGELAKIEYELEPAWASANRVVREFDTMRLREFTPHARAGPTAPVVVVAPYAGHSATIADFAGAPIDTDAGHGNIGRMAHALPMSFFEQLVRLGDGRMLGMFMLAGWKSMHPNQQYVDKYLDLYRHMEDPNYIERTERFERWFENPVDLPGRFYLQAVLELFKENRLAKGTFVALGRKLDLRDIVVPLCLLAGERDDITPPSRTTRPIAAPSRFVYCNERGGFGLLADPLRAAPP